MDIEALADVQTLVAAWLAVIVDIPAPITFTTPFVIVTTDGSEEVNVQAPSEFELGGASVKSGSLTTFCRSDQDPTVGFRKILKVIVNGAGAAYVVVAAWVAVIVTVPAFTNETWYPFIAAMLGSEEVNVHAPVELDVGAVRVIDEAVDKFAVTLGKVPTTGVGP